ncbi:MAG: M20 family peptidase [candidate division Zixibacteria bacterium]|nr:M20 family peptidase [candidate division Zixibacteria bacterium]
MKRFLIGVGFAVVILISVLCIRTFSSFEAPTEVTSVSINADFTQCAQHLSQAVQYQTVTFQDPGRIDRDEFISLQAYLETTFPTVFATLRKEVFGELSLLLTWQGRDSTLNPILLLAHQDVVPVSPGTEENWIQPPFSGIIIDGYIWGRGTLDMKSGLLGILEAVEALLKEGFQPKRTIMLVFGHDEESGGIYGAKEIAEYLHSRNIHFEYVLDEGGLISEGIITDVADPVALIGIAEKGIVSLKLSVEAEGGHSSMPGKNTAVGILCKAITRLEDNLFPANMEYAEQLFAAIAPEMPFFNRMILSNLWLFRPLVQSQLEESRSGNASIRTTTAATMISGGEKENVLPVKATAVVNFRIMPGETIPSVLKYVEETISDSQVEVEVLNPLMSTDPSPMASTSSKSYDVIRKSILQVSDEKLLVAPYVLVGATDSRHFTGISDNVYRFLFNRLKPDDLKRIHGTNERISVKNYEQTVKFYYQLLRNSQHL